MKNYNCLCGRFPLKNEVEHSRRINRLREAWIDYVDRNYCSGFTKRLYMKAA
jgi:hypothetical protein